VSPPGRPKGETRSAQREGTPGSPPGRPKGETRSAQREGTPGSPPGRPKGEARSAQREGTPETPPGLPKGEHREPPPEGVRRAPARPRRAPPLALPAGIDVGQLLHTLFRDNNDALLVVAPDGRIAASNPAATRLLGYAADELLGLDVDRLVPEPMRPRHAGYRAGYARAARARPMGAQLELAALHRDGSEVLVEVALSPVHGADAGWVLAALRDIGAYPRVRQAMRRARYSEALAGLGRLAADARDTRQLLPRVPEVALEALGADAARVWRLQPGRRELVVVGSSGLPAGEPLGHEQPNSPHSLAGLVLASAAPVLVEDYAAEQRFAVPPACFEAGLRSAVGAPLADRGRPFGALIVHTREPRRFGPDELRFVESLAHLLATWLQRALSDEALSHAQRLESVGQLTGGIAHDFNNLLTVIQGNLQVLDELPILPAASQARQLVAAAMRASRRGAELTGKLLAFSRRQVLQPCALDLHQMLPSLADMLRRTLDQRIRIELDLAPEPLAVLVDPGQLESALLNIAINARDAMHDGGTLRFHASTCRALPPAVRLTLEDPSAADERFVTVSVSDTGTGMTDEVKERAFEPFFTTKEAGRGTGLGLSTVYGFARQSRGAVAIDSAPGAGTTLTLFLPRPWQPAASEGEGAEAAAPPGRLRPGLAVLLVEDDVDVREVVRSYLDALGCRVTAVASGEQALHALDGPAGIDLLLSDVALGAGMRGTALARQARDRRPGLPVLLMSGYSSELLAADREVLPEAELLRKPYTRDELAAAIARVTARRPTAA
jgi:PAS domain S-box-containing protein